MQKKSIAKRKEEKEKQEAIEIKEKLYLHLKSMLAKQVGPEAVEQANDFVKALKDKKLQLRHMDTELNMYQAQVREYKYSIGILNAGLADIKKKFLHLYMKRAEQAAISPRAYQIELKQNQDNRPPLPVRESPENDFRSEEGVEYEENRLVGKE